MRGLFGRDGGSANRELDVEFTEIAQATVCPTHGLQPNVRVFTATSSGRFVIDGACCEEHWEAIMAAFT